MEDEYVHRKPYCKEGESESYIAAALAVVACIISVPAWLFFLWAIGATVL